MVNTIDRAPHMKLSTLSVIQIALPAETYASGSEVTAPSYLKNDTEGEVIYNNPKNHHKKQLTFVEVLSNI